jgi:RNA polymerase sigma factor (sigma-70 family)
MNTFHQRHPQHSPASSAPAEPEDDAAAEGLEALDAADEESIELDQDAGVVGEDKAAATPAPALRRSLPDASEAQVANWIAAIVFHDEQALAALYDATLSRVYGFVLGIVRRPQLAEEVVEDTFFQVWRQAARYDASRGRAVAWLLGMARSRAIDALRREARFQAVSIDDDQAAEVVSQQPAAEQLMDQARGHAGLHAALMRLSPQSRQLVALSFFRGLSHEEIAEQTALPLGTVKSQIRRALQQLQKLLGDNGRLALAA